MGWILDLLIVGIIVLMMWQCARRGFVRTVIELIGYILSLVLAFTLSSVLANFVYKTFLRAALIKTVEGQLTAAASGNVGGAVTGIFDNLPGVVSNAAAGFGVSRESVAQQIEAKISQGAAEAAPAITDFIAQKILVSLLSMIFLFILFIAFMFIVRILAKIINKAFSIPVLGTANRLLGAGIGIFKGLVLVIVLTTVISLILPLTRDGIWFITPEAVDKSLLFGPISNLSPLK